MKNFIKFIFMLIVLVSTSMACNAQGKNGRFHFKDVYKQVDSILIENAALPSENGDYIVELPRESKLVIAYNAEHLKAIVLYSDYRFIKHMEYNVKDNDTRLILWYMDKGKHIYCGFIYDKKSKTARYFEAINEAEKERLVKRLPFLKYAPTFE